MKKKIDYRVIPNLSLRGKEIKTRLNNRSLLLQSNGQYSLNEQIEATRRMNKADIILEHRKTTGEINNYKNQLQNANGNHQL